MPMLNRQYGANYRFGFNGQEKDNEIEGNGNLNTAEFWEYDSRLGRRWNVDPVAKRWESSYATFSNNPLRYIDINGKTPNDYFNDKGNKIGTDGDKDNNGKFVVTNEDEANKIKNDSKSGKTTPLSDVKSAVALPSDVTLKQAVKVLDAQNASGSGKEQIPSLVMKDGTILEANEGGDPYVKMEGGTKTLISPSNLPVVPSGYTDNDVEASIHPHPTIDIYVDEMPTPSHADRPLDPADRLAFRYYHLNIIVGRLGTGMTSDMKYDPTIYRPLGIVLYNQDGTQILTLTRKAVMNILKK
jgi:hypothetical protein